MKLNDEYEFVDKRDEKRKKFTRDIMDAVDSVFKNYPKRTYSTLTVYAENSESIYCTVTLFGTFPPTYYSIWTLELKYSKDADYLLKRRDLVEIFQHTVYTLDNNGIGFDDEFADDKIKFTWKRYNTNDKYGDSYEFIVEENEG